MIQEKRRLRAELRLRLSGTDPRGSGDALPTILAASGIARRGAVLAAFTSWGGEVDMAPLIEACWQGGSRLLFPKVAGDGATVELLEATAWSDFEPGYQGILEPSSQHCLRVDPTMVEVVLVPGLAFDRLGTRLGRGKGHYDRLLARIGEPAVRVGVCHPWQVMEAPVAPLPREPHDVPMHWILTPQGAIRCEGA